jgi:hypothetical protein
MSAESDRLLPVQPVGRLTAPEGTPYPVTVSVGPDGPIALWAAPGAHEQLAARFRIAETDAAAAPDEPASVVIAAYGRADLSPVEIVPVNALPTSFPMIQPLAGRGYLVVDPRCEWHPEGATGNALVLRHDGAILDEGCLGDGVSRLQTDSDGSIWAGYFAEGVTGANGWGDPGPRPLGAAGIVQWSAAFEKQWEQPGLEPGVADCYALNVDEASVWACTDPGFPVLEIRDGHTTVSATTDVNAPRGLVVSGDRIAFIGGRGDPWLVVAGRLVDGAFAEEWRGRLTLPDGSPLPIATAHCRGSRAHFFAGPNWQVFDLDEVD